MTDTGRMELLEREPSLALLAGCAAEARRGDGRLVVLGGEAGVGKTALLERFQRDLRDARWSWGACDGLFTPRPLGPLYDLADQLGGELLELCARGASRDELFRALLRQVSGPGLVNVVVEDIHWADEATMDLLRFAGRRLRDTRVLLVVTFRDDDLATDDQLRVALGELARHRTTRRIALAPLSADAVRALAGGSRLEAAALYQLTGENPFYLTEVLQAGMAEVAMDRRAPARRVVGDRADGPRAADRPGRGPAGRGGPTPTTTRRTAVSGSSPPRSSCTPTASPTATTTTSPTTEPSCAASAPGCWRRPDAGTRRWPCARTSWTGPLRRPSPGCARPPGRAS